MFPLKTNTLPTDASELARCLNESLRDLFNLPADPVSVRDASYPHLATLTVSLDGAQLRAAARPIPRIAGKATPALTVDAFEVTASPMSVGPAAIDFVVKAADLELHRAADPNGNIVLVLHKAKDGRIQLSASPADLEALIAEMATTEAARQGVAIDRVQLTLRSNSPRSLAAEVRLRAKKLFLSTTLKITGQVDLDDELTARLTGLSCSGEGAIASVACGVLQPHLVKLEGREFPLMSLPLGEVRLRDVRIVAGDQLSITAQFGSA